MSCVLTLALVPVPVGQAAEPDTVKVFFSRDADSFNDFTAVFPMPRTVVGGRYLVAGVGDTASRGDPTGAGEGSCGPTVSASPAKAIESTVSPHEN